MPVISYLALPKPGQMKQMCADLARMEHCEIIPADNQEVAILVTDTPDEQTEHRVLEELKRLSSLQSLSMTFGCNTEQ
jgi:nitrate reductase NapAB chaperone NapD